MIYHMKTTLILPEHLLRQLKRRAARRGETLSAVVEEVIRRGLREHPPVAEPAPLPLHHMGRPRVDLADRDALYAAMDEG